MRKVTLLKLDFKSYLKFIIITFLSLGLFWGLLDILASSLGIDGSLNFGELVLLVRETASSFLIVGIMAIVSFWVFNFSLKHIKKISIDIEFDGDLNQKVIRVKRFGLFGLIKLLTLISIINVCVLGTPALLFSFLSAYWLLGIFIIIGLLILFLINSLFTSFLLFFILNAILDMVKGITIRGEFHEIDGFDAEKSGSTSQRGNLMVESPGKRSRFKISICLCIIALLGFLLFSTLKSLQIKKGMELHLKKEYGKEFVIKKIYYGSDSLGGPTRIYGTAFPKDDPSIHMVVSTSPEDTKFEVCDDESEDNPTENYREIIWNKQLAVKLRKKLNYKLIATSVYPSYEDKELKGRIISIDEAEKSLKPIDLYITYGFIINLNDFCRQKSDFEKMITGKLSQEQKENLFHIIQKLKSDNYNNVRLQLTYINKRYSKKALNNPERYLDTDYTSYDGNDPFLCEVLINDVNNIKQPDDIGKHIDLDCSRIYLYNLP